MSLNENERAAYIQSLLEVEFADTLQVMPFQEGPFKMLAFRDLPHGQVYVDNGFLLPKIFDHGAYQPICIERIMRVTEHLSEDDLTTWLTYWRARLLMYVILLDDTGNPEEATALVAGSLATLLDQKLISVGESTI